MRRFIVLVSVFLFVINFTYAQDTDSPVLQFDEAVSNLAREIHTKLVEKRADKIVIGQFIFQDGVPPFSSYWTNQLIAELTNIRGRNYSVFSGSAPDAEWFIQGEIVHVADIIRVYSILINATERGRAIESSFYSSFSRDEHISDMISSGSSGSGSSSARRDIYEPDSWDEPVHYTIGTSPTASLMNRILTEGDEDFFLLVPDRDGRLTMETVGSTDTYMHFYNYDNGDELASDDDSGQGTNARIIYNVRSGTRYLAVVRGYSSSTTGAYSFRAYLTVREGASSFDNPISYEIGVNENSITTVNRRLQEGDMDYFLLVPVRSGRVIIETTGRIDTYMELYDEDEEMLDENDDGGQNYNARIRYNVEAGRHYIVLVRGYSSNVTGNYGFRAYFSGQGLLTPDEYEPNDEPDQATAIKIGDTQQHTFHTGDDVDWFIFQVTQAGQYTIHTRGLNNNRLDTYIELYDNNLNLIAEDDDGGNGLSSMLVLNLNRGTYYLKVWCLDEEPDQGYSISISGE